MSNLFQPTALVGAIAIAMGFSSSVQAADQTTATTKLDTIVVTATRSEENIKDVPARITVIEPKIVEQSPIASFPDLLKHDAAINMVQNGGMGQLADIYLRGTESDHTLILRDGVRLNNASSGTASLAFIDTTDIKQIEVLKGPASVLYGTDAIGGVVQLVSKKPVPARTPKNFTNSIPISRSGTEGLLKTNLRYRKKLNTSAIVQDSRLDIAASI